MLRELVASGWSIDPHVRFAYRGTQLLHTFGSMDIEQYIDYWHEHIDDTVR